MNRVFCFIFYVPVFLFAGGDGGKRGVASEYL